MQIYTHTGTARTAFHIVKPLHRQHASSQRGLTLVELMVGIAIGLLVVAVAMGAMMVSRGVSGTVSDASNIQQQAAYAMRVIGQQVRQAGSLYLNLSPGTTTVEDAYMEPVAFESKADASGGNSFDPKGNTLTGTATSMTVGYRRYTEDVYINATPISLARNCVGAPDDASTDMMVENIFELDGTKLVCGGNSADKQPIIDHVANAQVRYIVQDTTTTPGNPTTKTVDASSVTSWDKVQAIEICLVLYGSEKIDLPTGSTYIDCDGTTPIDMSTLTGERAKRMHLVFRNVFQLRSQGLIGSVL